MTLSVNHTIALMSRRIRALRADPDFNDPETGHHLRFAADALLEVSQQIITAARTNEPVDTEMWLVDIVRDMMLEQRDLTAEVNTLRATVAWAKDREATAAALGRHD